jgi:hypothetical protein
MLKTYHVLLQPGGTIDWGADGPPMIPSATEVAVTVPTAETAPEERAARGERLRIALEAVAASNPFRDIVDPVEWQREIRKDRPLPGREE